MGIQLKELRNAAMEEKARQVELAIEAGKPYHFDRQEELLLEEARLVNIIDVREFSKRLSAAGVKHRLTYAGLPGTAGLWVYTPGYIDGEGLKTDWKYICYVQQPFMPEWSVLRVSEYNVPLDWKYKGWRTVILELLNKARHCATVEKLHEAFGRPCEGVVSERYRRQLHYLRNPRREEKY